MIARTMLYRKPSASTSTSTRSPSRSTVRSKMVRTLLARFGHSVSKLRKSCRPKSAWRWHAWLVDVHGPSHMPGVTAPERTGHPAVVDHVTIPLRTRVQRRVKGLGNLVHSQHANIRRHQSIQRFLKSFKGVLRDGQEVTHLTHRMHSRVGSAAGRAGRSGARELADRRFHAFLHGSKSRLLLPAMKLGAVVADRQLDVAHGWREEALAWSLLRLSPHTPEGWSLATSSAICTAFVAAPFRKLSLTHQKSRTLGRSPCLIRPTNTSSFPAAAAARG